MEALESLAQVQYMKKKRTRAAVVRALQWGLLAAALVLWEVSARLGWIDAFLLSCPSRMLDAIVGLARDGSLFTHVGMTLFETVAGFVLGGLLGLLAAIALWWSDLWWDVLDPYLVVINSLPKIALGPVLIVWIGVGMPAIIAMALLVSVIVTLMTVITGFKAVSPDKIKLLRSFGATRFQVLRMVILPASVPAIISALKLNIGMSWVGVIVGEFLVSRAGLGYLIVYGGQVFKLDLVMASTAILCTLAAAMYLGIAAIEKRVNEARGAR